MAERLSQLALSIRRLGLRGTVSMLLARSGIPAGRARARVHSLRVRGLEHKLLCRARTSDRQVFSQVFLHRQYELPARQREIELIVDCGANVGYTSVFFLARYPRAEVLAVEPDAQNFALLLRNVAAYRDRVKAVRSAVWSHPATLAIAEQTRRDGQEWGRQVEESDRERGELTAITIDELLSQSSHPRISILKIDIEGAEAVVFSEGFDAWLPKVDTLVIELHDDPAFPHAAEIFHRAIAGEGFAVAQRGELTVCTRDGAASH